ncbi:MAG: hypothetical protein Q9M19_03370 [Mariprofundaceae bacterium]|nr:hypothetical protein [Mariprofundaceae bacterium]
MRNSLNSYIKRKQRKRRFWTILLLTIFMAISATLFHECKQSFDQPYNKDYRPLDRAPSSFSGEIHTEHS